ncbi:MAG: NnrU family protein [Alphaproteobacteria bacterium]|jgi:uncharacterized membrane protein|nr:NnrU family protein [Alphaproteobacteria bacterium]|tara:strand:- start:36 stop:692 length:657 start_codon:yes stop_codon:yes gene_type:complete
MSLWVLFWAVAAFVGGHFVVSGTPVRARIVKLIGERAFKALFGVYALATLAWVVLAYANAPYMPLWPEAAALGWITLVLSAAGLLLLVPGAMTRKPDGAGSGIHAVTRHPMNWGIALWAVGHLVVNGDAASALLFGGILLLALGGSVSQDRKAKVRLGADWEAYAKATSSLPLAAILSGRAKMRLADIGWPRLVIAVVVIVVLIGVHEILFGVAPLPV